eukprot:5162000-Prymnesium_polylepis.1
MSRRLNSATLHAVAASLPAAAVCLPFAAVAATAATAVTLSVADAVIKCRSEPAAAAGDDYATVARRLRRATVA